MLLGRCRQQCRGPPILCSVTCSLCRWSLVYCHFRFRLPVQIRCPAHWAGWSGQFYPRTARCTGGVSLCHSMPDDPKFPVQCMFLAIIQYSRLTLRCLAGMTVCCQRTKSDPTQAKSATFFQDCRGGALQRSRLLCLLRGWGRAPPAAATACLSVAKHFEKAVCSTRPVSLIARPTFTSGRPEVGVRA